jgi:hypothetical protein
MNRQRNLLRPMTREWFYSVDCCLTPEEERGFIRQRRWALRLTHGFAELTRKRKLEEAQKIAAERQRMFRAKAEAAAAIVLQDFDKTRAIKSYTGPGYAMRWYAPCLKNLYGILQPAGYSKKETAQFFMTNSRHGGLFKLKSLLCNGVF